MRKLNAEQIKMALECCISAGDCTLCPLIDEQSCPCILNENALALICEYEERIEDLETLIFAFVLEMGITHADRQGKNKDEISDKVLEVIREKEKRVLYPQMRRRMQEAKARLEAKEVAEDAEE